MQTCRRRGFSLLELLIVIAIILVISAIAIPTIRSARQFSLEMAAVRQIDTIHSAQTQYYSQFGRFATTLAELGPPATGADGPAAAGLIPENLARGAHNGYQFLMQGGPNGYTINANPVTFSSTGRRTFFSDQTLVKRENWGQEPATVSSPAIASAGRQLTWAAVPWSCRRRGHPA